MNSPKIWMAALVAVLLLGFTLFAWDARPAPEPHVVEGNKQYRQRLYRDALVEYESAPGAGPRNAGVQLDRGLARFRNALPPGDGGVIAAIDPEAGVPEGVTKAQEELRTAGRGGTTNAGEDVDAFLRAEATYDLGNTWFAARSWDNAIESYKESLRLRPAWKDAAWNLELARRAREEDRHPPDAGTPDASPPDASSNDGGSPDAGDQGDAGPQGNDGGSNTNDGGVQGNDGGSPNANDSGNPNANDAGNHGGQDGGAPPTPQDAGAPPRSLAPLDDLDRSVRSLQNERLRVTGHAPRNPDDDR